MRNHMEKVEAEEKWRSMTKQQKIQQLKMEGEETKVTPEMRKKRRQEDCMRRSKNWKTWREPEAEINDDEEAEPVKVQGGGEPEDSQPTEALSSEEVAYKASEEAIEAEEEGEEPEPPELEERGELCLHCVNIPCLCLLIKLDLRLEMLRKLEKKQIEMASREAEEGCEKSEVVAEEATLLHEVVLEQTERPHDHPARNQVETRKTNNKNLLSSALGSPCKPDRTRADGHIHHGGMTKLLVSKSVLNLKPVETSRHGPIHRENHEIEVVNVTSDEVCEVASEQVDYETCEVVSDLGEPAPHTSSQSQTSTDHPLKNLHHTAQ